MSNFPPASVLPCADPSERRLAELVSWLARDASIHFDRIVPTCGDASFRRYFRVFCGKGSLIAMDAPPPAEDVGPFIQVAQLLHRAGVHVPVIHEVDAERGFVLLSDLGHLCYRDELTAETADRLYWDAIDALATYQTAIDIRSCERPLYDEPFFRRELGLFREWYLQRCLGIDLSPAETALFEAVSAKLVQSALEQPRVFVHRDYHSRNLMVCLERNPGILDFQDAVIGPISYDLVSLLRDCYISWPQSRVDLWVSAYLEMFRERNPGIDFGEAQFRRWFDLMGLQRHLKAIGIFARLKLRDGKVAYLHDIPRTLGYVMDVCGRYPELSEFRAFLEQEVVARSADEVVA